MGRHQAFAVALAEYGWNAHLISASTSRPTGSSGRLTRADGVDCRWLPTPKYKGNGPGRVVNMASYTALSAMQGIRHSGLPRPDLVWGSTVHPGAPLAAAMVAKRFSVPFVYEVRDLWPETFIAMGRQSRSSLASKSLFGLERQLGLRSDLLLSPLGGIGRYFNERYGVPETKFACYPNGIQAERIAAEGVLDPSPSETTTFTFTGSMGNVNGMNILIDAFSNHAKEYGSSLLRLVGDGPKRGELESIVRQRGLEERVEFTGWVEFEKVPEYLAATDWTVAVIDDLPDVFRYGVSYVKLPEYLAAGRPMLLGANISDDLVELSGGGISVHPDPSRLARGFTEAAKSSAATRLAMASAGRAYASEYLTYESMAPDLADRLNSVSASG
jgi:glycosyltransferase involved in cell wall biosynthesis